MTKRHAVVDGSNLATEGRSEPSLAQLDEAVATLAAENDFNHITVVVDASFEHRVADKEQRAAKKAIDDGRILTPPAGVVGRGDTFILEVAEKADAVVVSNDSFQEFHGRFDWLFEEGRLIGGKPVEKVGWVFVPRVPVRGKTSREAVRRARSNTTKKGSAKKASADKATSDKATSDKARKKSPAKKAAAKAAESPKRAPAKKAAGRSKKSASTADRGSSKQAATRKAARKKKSTTKEQSSKKQGDEEKTTRKKQAAPDRSRSRRGSKRASGKDSNDDAHNPVRAWRRFRSRNPVGSEVEATVEQYSSHGAHAVTADGLKAYVPSQLLADPPPKRARDVITEGETRTFVVHELDEERRGIDLGLVPVPGGSR